MCIQLNPSILDTLRPEGTVLIIVVPTCQGLKMYYGKTCRIILFPVVCVPARELPAIQRSGIEGFHCVRMRVSHIARPNLISTYT